MDCLVFQRNSPGGESVRLRRSVGGSGHALAAFSRSMDKQAAATTNIYFRGARQTFKLRDIIAPRFRQKDILVVSLTAFFLHVYLLFFFLTVSGEIASPCRLSLAPWLTTQIN